MSVHEEYVTFQAVRITICSAKCHAHLDSSSEQWHPARMRHAFSECTDYRSFSAS